MLTKKFTDNFSAYSTSFSVDFLGPLLAFPSINQPLLFRRELSTSFFKQGIDFLLEMVIAFLLIHFQDMSIFGTSIFFQIEQVTIFVQFSKQIERKQSAHTFEAFAAIQKAFFFIFFSPFFVHQVGIAYVEMLSGQFALQQFLRFLYSVVVYFRYHDIGARCAEPLDKQIFIMILFLVAQHDVINCSSG